MQATSTLFTSFGLLLTLMLHRSKHKFSIHQEVQLTIYPTLQEHDHDGEPHDKDIVTPDKRKKGKKSKKINKVQSLEEFPIYPRTVLTELVLQENWRKQQQCRNVKSEFIGREIQALQNYFLEDLKAIIPYNGRTGNYSLNVQIPGATYSDIPISIKIPQCYPEFLPQIEINTNNLHPVQKQKLLQLLNQQQQLFKSTYTLYFPASNPISNPITNPVTNPITNAITNPLTNPVTNAITNPLTNPVTNPVTNAITQQYLSGYYPYILNLCVCISQELFYRPDLMLMTQMQQGEVRVVEKEKDEGETGGLNVPVNKEKDIKKEFQKEIYQNIVLEILNRDEEERDNLNYVQKPVEYNIPKHPNPRGRYKADYQQLHMIGQGGFGRVYRCKHRIDSNIYAVKKMVINYNDPHSFKLLKQVAVLSKLNHPNIVRYHQSWLEDTSSVEQLITDMMITDDEEIEEFNKIWKKYSKEHQSKDRDSNHCIQEESQSDENQYQKSQSDLYADIRFQESQQRQNFRSDQDSVIFGDDAFEDYSSYVEFKKSKKSGEDKEDSSYSKSTPKKQQLPPRKHSQFYEFPFKVLYIVMQYCGSMTLKDFITKKFHEPNNIKIQLIRGMLQGLSYIHSRRIIHRDLKPANIFLIQNMNKVKIGDFGLATIGNFQNNPYEAEIIQYSDKTKGVGTFFYRAPEQVSSTQYDEKIDIYSLGIILLQMFYQFQTGMQRYQVLNQVTRTHRLPKDFTKIQNNCQFEQPIQSCLSVKPSDRPTIQKLLQTFRNKYFTQLVFLIANPKHFQFYQLMNHLFGIKNQSNVIMKQNLFKNYLTQEFTQIYQIHRGVLFTPLSLVPVVDYQNINGIKIPSSRKQKFLLLSQRGVLMEYPSNTYTSWIRYAKETMKRNIRPESHNYRHEYMETCKQMRRFTFEKVSQYIGGDSKSQFSFKEKYVTAFDICYEIENGFIAYFLCEMLNISLLMIETMQLTQRFPPLYLCHSLIYKCLAIQYNVSQANLHKFLLAINDDKFRAMKNQVKVELMKSFGLEGNIVKRIITLMETQFQDQEEFINSFKIRENEHSKIIRETQLNALVEKIEDEIMNCIEPLKIFKLYDRVKWKYQIPSTNTNGLFWNVGPVRGFTSVEEYLGGQQICNLHLQTSLNPCTQQNEAQVSIWSTGEFLEKDILEIVAKCWQNNITAKWYDKNLGQKDLTCLYNIILKKKNERVYMMVRKNYQNVERTLQKKNSEDVKDKEEKQRAFILKQHFNFQVLKQLIRDQHRKGMPVAYF